MIYQPKEEHISTFASVEDFDGIEGTPWEKLAYKVPTGASVPEMLKAAKLDWEVQHLPVFANAPVANADGEIEVDSQGNPLSTIQVPVPKSFCLRRADNGDFLSPFMGNRYKPVQNEYAFTVFDQFVKAGDMRIVTAGSLHGGKHIWGLASINEEFILGDGEVIHGYFLLMQSHAYGYSLKAMFTPVRYPGGHTIVTPIRGVGGKTGFYAMPHSRVFDDARIEEIKDVLVRASDQFKEFEGKARFLAGTKLTEKDGVLYLAELFDPKLIRTRKLDKLAMPETLDELLAAGDANNVIKKAAGIVQTYPGHDLDSCNGTAWGFYQGVVHSLDHQMGHKPDTRLESSWLGKNFGLKTKALDLSVVMATKAE